MPTTQTGTSSAGDGTSLVSVGGLAALASVKTPVTVGGDESGTAASFRPASVVAWLPDHLHVLRETVGAESVPAAAAVPHLLLLTYLFCAEMFACQLVLMLPNGGRTAP